MTAAECARATTCVTYADCELGPDGTCKPSEPHLRCEAETAYRDEVRFTLDDPGCVDTSVGDCRSSSECRSLGHCSVLEEICGAVTQEDGTEPDRCKLLGMCAPNVGECGQYGHH